MFEGKKTTIRKDEYTNTKHTPFMNILQEDCVSSELIKEESWSYSMLNIKSCEIFSNTFKLIPAFTIL